MDGTLWRYERPRDGKGPLHGKRVTPSGVGYKQDLYRTTYEPTPEKQQWLETDFFQRIDDRAATALAKLELDQPSTPEERVGFGQFVLSLLHRTPARISWMVQELERRMANDPASIPGWNNEQLRNGALDMLADLVGSKDSARLMASFRIFRIDVTDCGLTLLTSDRPAMISNGLLGDRGFFMLPIGPRALAIATQNEAVAKAFAGQEPRKLVRAMNDAVIQQADRLVIATDDCHRRFIDNRLGKGPLDPTTINPEDGIMRWQAPL